jgi:hypothetical protein
VQEWLPRCLSKEVFDCIDDWYGERPQIQPPHVRDLMTPRYSNFEMEKDGDDAHDSVRESLEPIDLSKYSLSFHHADPTINVGC